MLQVEENGLGAEAGLRDQDVITAVDLTQIYNMSDLWHALLRNGASPVARLSVVRKSAHENILIRRPINK